MSYHSKTNSVAFTNNNRSCYTHARNLTKISPFTLWIPYDLYTVTVIVGGDSGIQADLILACSHIIQAHFAVVRFMKKSELLNIGDMVNRNPHICNRVNKKLLPVKFIYFTSISAIGTLIPYIPVYMKELGISPTEMGILYGLMPFISFFTRPLFGALADKIRKHKIVLEICFLSMALFYGLLLVTPCKPTASDCNSQVQRLSECVLNKTYKTFCKTNISEATTLGTNICKISIVCQRDLNMYHKEESFGNLESTNESKIGDLKQNGTYLSDETSDFACGEENHFHCDSSSTSSPSNLIIHCIEEETNFGKTFVVFFIIYLFANISFSPIYNLVDAMAYDILGNKRDLWGRQRLWGTAGFALFAMISSFIVDMRNKDTQTSRVDYSVSFFIFIGLCVISAVVTSRLPLSESVQCKHFVKNIAKLLHYPQIMAFMIVITFIGIFFAVIQGFLFWYLRDIGSTQLNLGLCLLSNCIAEIIMFAVAGKIIKLVGHAACLYAALTAFAVRFISFSFLSNPWFAPLIEILHGLSFGLMYDAATEYASIISPAGMTATVQGLIGGLYFGFGRGIGGLVTGKLFDPVSGIGEVWTFRLYGGLALVVLAVYGIINASVFSRPVFAPRRISIVITAEKSDEVFVESQLLSVDRDNEFVKGQFVTANLDD